MKKGEFVKAVLRDCENGLGVGDGEKIVKAVFRNMAQAVCDEGRFIWPGFGTFTVKERAARQGRNPKTGETMRVEASRTVLFKPAPGFKGNL